MSNLKPCPFCGGAAELCYAPGLGTDSCRGYTLYASCKECCAKSPGLWQEKKPEPDDQSWKGAADEWNHRPGEPDPENCSVACCEHYPEGLPVCGMMKGKSMSEIYKLVQAIESYNESDLCLGTLRSLKKIKDAAAMLETELADKDRQIAEMRTEIEKQDTLLEKCLSLLKQQKEKEEL